MKKLNKKASFDTINQGLIAFIAFVLISILTILLIATLMKTSTVCGGTWDDQQCVICKNSSYTYTNITDCCWTGTTCLGTTNKSVPLPYDGAAYNATLDLQEAGTLAPQFSQIILIVIIIVGILALMAFIGFSAYQRLKR